MFRTTPLILPADFLESLQRHVLLGFTGQTRVASELAKTQIEKMEQGKSNVNELLFIAKEALSLFRNQEDMKKIGTLLHQAWCVKRSLAHGITNPAIDELYEAGRRAGAYGGKLLGAGGGGFIMFLAPPERHARIKEALSKIRVWVPFHFETHGAQVVFHNDEY